MKEFMMGSKAEWMETASKVKTNGRKFTSLSGKELDICYTPEDIKETNYYSEIITHNERLFM